jgi:hypothetical protein
VPAGKELTVTVVCVGAGHTCSDEGPQLAIVGVTSYPHGVKLERLSDGRLLIAVPGADPYVLRSGGPDPFALARAIDDMFARGAKNPSREESSSNRPAVAFVSAACAETSGLHCGAAYASALDKDYVNFYGGWEAVYGAAEAAKGAFELTLKGYTLEDVMEYVKAVGKAATGVPTIDEAKATKDPADLIKDFLTTISETHPELCDDEFTCDYSYQ